jgi:hypothetical protein
LSGLARPGWDWPEKEKKKGIGTKGAIVKHLARDVAGKSELLSVWRTILMKSGCFSIASLIANALLVYICTTGTKAAAENPVIPIDLGLLSILHAIFGPPGCVCASLNTYFFSFRRIN